MTAGLWSVIAGGIGLFIAGVVFGPIGLLCGIVGVLGAVARLQMGQLLLSLFGIVTSVVATVTSWGFWLGLLAVVAAGAGT